MTRTKENKIELKKFIHIGIIACAVMSVLSYSMIQIQAVDTSFRYLEEKQSSMKEQKKQSAWNSLQGFVNGLLGGAQDTQQNNKDSTVLNNNIIWHDKEKLNKLKLTEKLMDSDCQTNNTFPDVDGHQYQNDIEWASKNCVIQGYQNGKFYPDNHLKYGDLISMIQSSLQKGTNSTISVNLLTEVINSKKKNQDVLTLNEFKSIITLIPTNSEKEITWNIEGDLSRIATRGDAVHVLNQLAGIDNSEIKNSGKENTIITKTNSVGEIIVTDSIQRLLERGIIKNNDDIISNPISAISRERFLDRTVKARQYSNSSIPQSLGNINYFKDVNEDSEYKNSLSLAKTMGLTSFLETTHRQDTYIQPKESMTVLEAYKTLNELGIKKFIGTEQDDTVLVTYEKAAELIKLAISDNTLDNSSINQNTITINTVANNGQSSNVVNNTDQNDDPWLVKQIKPYIKNLAEMW